MDPRLYTYQRRAPRLQNPTFKSQFVTDSLHVFRGGPFDSTPTKINKVTQIPFQQKYGVQMHYQPPEISRIRSLFQNNRSKVPLSSLSSYGRQVMFPTQTGRDLHQNDDYSSKILNPDNFFKKQLFLDNKQRNYIKQIYKMNEQFLTKSRLHNSVDKGMNQAAGRPSYTYDDKDKRHYRYKHSYDRQIQQKLNNNNPTRAGNNSFIPSRLNYADEMKGII